MNKLIKKYVLTAIVICLIAIIYGAIFNFILIGENASIVFSYVEVLLVGFLVTAIYLIMAFLLGYCLNEKDFYDTHGKRIITFMNTVATLLTCFGITILIANNEWTALNYAWTYIANLFFSALVVGKANYDGEKLRQVLSK